MQVGHDVVTSAICKSQLQFQRTNNYQLLYLTSSTYFQSAAVPGRRNTNSTPATSPVRKQPDYLTHPKYGRT
jgi:hypothetical protein